MKTKRQLINIVFTLNLSYNKRMKTTKYQFKRIYISIIAVIVILIGIVGIFLGIRNARKFYITYYDIPENIQTVFTKNINKYLKQQNSNRLPQFITLNKTVSLQKALQKQKKYDLIFTYNGRNLNSILQQNSDININSENHEIFKGITTSVREAVIKKGTYNTVPLLTNHFETCINNSLLKATKNKTPATFQQLNKFTDLCKKYSKISSTSDFPVQIQWGYFLNAANDVTLLEFLGAYIESTYGISACRVLEKKIIKKTTFKNLLTVKLNKKGITLENILTTFIQWRKTSLFHPDWITMTEKDVNNFMKRNEAPIVFMMLSTHRSLSYNTVNNYTVTHFPFNRKHAPSSFTAPLICGVSTAHKKTNIIAAEKILSYLISTSEQGILSSETGLAPVLVKATTPDSQADNVRYWIAATSAPYEGLDKAAFCTPKELHIFAENIRNAVR